MVGHSMAGEELSSIGTRHPEKISGLVYLDAAYPYAYYNKSDGDLRIDLQDIQRKLDRLKPGQLLAEKDLIRELMQDDLPQFENDLKGWYQQYGNGTSQAPPPLQPPSQTAADRASFATLRSWEQNNLGFAEPEGALGQKWEIKPDEESGCLTVGVPTPIKRALWRLWRVSKNIRTSMFQFLRSMWFRTTWDLLQTKSRRHGTRHGLSMKNLPTDK